MTSLIKPKENKKKLSENLKIVIRNDYIIWEVVKALTPEQVFGTRDLIEVGVNVTASREKRIFEKRPSQ